MVRTFQTLNPCSCPDCEPNATKQYDDDEHPAQAANSFSDIVDTRATDEICKECECEQRRSNFGKRWTTVEVTLHNQTS